jgi:HEPN domain-containing protein
MDEPKLREVRQWIAKAGRDLRSAKRLFSDTPPLLDTAAYHCQQAAEKALKAFLAMHDIPFQKTHLLAPLVLQCMQPDPGFRSLQEAAEILTPFATAFRYPGEPGEPEATDVEEAIELAQRVVDFVSKRLPAEARSPG